MASFSLETPHGEKKGVNNVYTPPLFRNIEFDLHIIRLIIIDTMQDLIWNKDIDMSRWGGKWVLENREWKQKDSGMKAESRFESQS